MKRVKLRFLMRINALLGMVITFFGCGTTKQNINREIMCLYGVPTATYKVSGKVTNEQHKPLQDMNVVVRGYKNRPISDTVKTDAKGYYETTCTDFPVDTIHIVANDPAQNYNTDSVSVAVPKKERKKNEITPFNLGEYTFKENIQLKRK